MTSRLPPVPEDNRSLKGTGTPATWGTADDHSVAPKTDPDKIGQQGNTKVNTTNQGYQQDR
jgi:hypothetical protein